MKLGIIGTGWIVKDFLPELTKMEGLEIVSIMGSPQGFEKAQVLSEQYKIPNAVHDLDELCASGIDTVYVAVPNNLHFMYCRKRRTSPCWHARRNCSFLRRSQRLI